MTEDADLRLSIAALEDALALERRRLRQRESGREQAVAAERERCIQIIFAYVNDIENAKETAAAIRRATIRKGE